MSRTDYTATAKLLHWLIALLILVQFPLGWVMDDFSGVQKIQAFNFHKSLGLTVLALMIVRAIWRVSHPAPEAVRALPKRDRVLSHSVQGLIYLGVLAIVLIGWAMISVSKFPSSFFQIAIIPKLPLLRDLTGDQQKAYHDVFEAIHSVLGYLLLAAIAAHVAGALRHAILLKDGIFSTMMPRRSGKRSQGLSIALFALGTLAAAAGGAGQAHALEWSVKPEATEIAFVATGSGYTTKGTFGRFRIAIEFDPDEPAKASVRVLLDMTSVATGTPDADKALSSAEFFDPARFPTAQFAARGAEPAGNGKYVLKGMLTLKGVTKPVAVPFSIVIKEGTAKATAQAVLNRMDFGVGPKSVAGFPIDKDVKLTMEITAVRLDD